MITKHSETCSKKSRVMAPRSLDLIEAMHAAAEAAQPITGRGIGYKLFTQGIIASMAKSEMQWVYRLLREARERGIIPWEWIVRQSIVRTDRSAALLARLSKQGWAVVDPATLFNVTVRGHHRQMPIGYPGRDEAHPLCGAIRSDVPQSKPRGLS
jgi:hypothetical protein